MKFFRYSLFVVALTITTSLFSCKKYLDVNQTPNNPTAVPPRLLLPNALYGVAFANANELNRMTLTMMQYTAGAAGSPGAYDVYNLIANDLNNAWNGEFYGGSLTICQELIVAADRTNSPAYRGIAKILQAYVFGLATDIWGDVPYSQALRGKTGNVQPRFDSTEDIYLGNAGLGITSLIDLVRDGIADLGQTSALLPSSADDPVYNGNLNNWIRFGNTLILKFALNLSTRNPSLATTTINNLISSGAPLIVTNARNFNIPFGTANGSQNPITQYSFVSLFANDLIISTRFRNLLQTTLNNDPRISALLTNPTGNTIDNGFAGTRPAAATFVRLGPFAAGAGSSAGVTLAVPVRIMTASMRAFMLAEAVTRLGVTGVANTLYQEGINLSMQDCGVAAGTITSYFAANPGIVTLSGTPANQLSQIMTQKYVAQTGNGVEAWTDWRRTGFPTLTVSQNALGQDGTIPRRALYPTNEIERNPNIPERGTIPTNRRIWWDVN